MRRRVIWSALVLLVIGGALTAAPQKSEEVRVSREYFLRADLLSGEVPDFRLQWEDAGRPRGVPRIAVLLQFSGASSSEGVLGEMRKRKLQPATRQEAITFGFIVGQRFGFPDAVVALGSQTRGDPRHVLSFENNQKGRGIDIFLAHWSARWPAGTRFLATRPLR